VKLKNDKRLGFSMGQYRCSTIWPTQQLNAMSSHSEVI
jgi:hypothetical protein